MWRRAQEGSAQVLLAHFGGPYWARKDDGAWGVPKGLIEADETPEEAARREFQEEMGVAALGPLLPLGQVRQSGGKVVEVFALEGEFDCAALVSNTIPLEWPPRSGQVQDYPEIDRAQWFDLEAAESKILPSQRPVLNAFKQRVLEAPA